MSNGAQNRNNIKLSGTLGYVAPEYLLDGMPTFILLDSNFNAKLSIFGLAMSNGAQNRNNIKLSGTLGYVAPEYLLDGSLPNLLTTTHFLSSYLSPFASGTPSLSFFCFCFFCASFSNGF
ncbi:putative serine/threonine-protein kinase pbl1 [Quercus suber]|uniref:Serine/threonine-protein kinase pbl1 n=1 Tax=Quercus suber TaxID=58331 RepID=A0AAW0LM48_QUESU